jgi:putative ABC transport system permease protein
VAFPDGDAVYRYDAAQNRTTHTNQITDEYLAYIGQMEASLGGVTSTIAYTRGVDFNLLARSEDTVLRFDVDDHRHGKSPGNRLHVCRSCRTIRLLSCPCTIWSGETAGDGIRGEIAIVWTVQRMKRALFANWHDGTGRQFTVTSLLGTTQLKVSTNVDFMWSATVRYSCFRAEYGDLFSADTGIT